MARRARRVSREMWSLDGAYRETVDPRDGVLPLVGETARAADPRVLEEDARFFAGLRERWAAESAPTKEKDA